MQQTRMRMLKIVKYPHGYRSAQIKNKRLSIKDIGALIREHDYDIEVENQDGFDFTKETLFRIAFEDVISPSLSEEKVMIFVEVINSEKLYEVINNGGIENFINRKARGFVI